MSFTSDLPSASGFASLLCGHVLNNRYRVEQIIGQGAMGAVFRAVDITSQTRVAVKVLIEHASDVAGRARLRSRQLREYSAAQLVNSRNVLRIMDRAVDDATGLSFLVSDLLEGIDIKTLLAVRTPDLWEWLTIGCSACDGLSALHSAGIVHRDVKPSNIFWRTDNTAVLLDLGIVQLPSLDRTLTPLTTPGFSPGTPKYASPEQRGGGVITSASDVYSMGLVLQELLGDLAGEGSSQRIMRWGGVSDYVDHLLSRALDPDPFRRLQSGGDLAVLVRLAGAEAIKPWLSALQQHGFVLSPLRIDSVNYDDMIWSWAFSHPNLADGWMSLECGVSINLVWDAAVYPDVESREGIAALKSMRSKLQVSDFVYPNATDDTPFVLRAFANRDTELLYSPAEFVRRYKADAYVLRDLVSGRTG